MRVPHAVDVADLPGQVEDDLAVPHEVVHRGRLAHVGDVDADAILDAGDVVEVAAVVGDQRVDEQHVGAELDQRVREVAADEAEAAGDHHAAAAVELARVMSLSVRDGRGARALRVEVLAPDDQRPPQLHHVDAGAEDAAEVEELRLAEGAVVVVHRHLGDTEAGVLELLHHLQADDAAVLLEPHHVEDVAAHQAEVAVHVAHLEPEEQLHGVVVDAADDDPVERIGAADLPAVDPVHIRRRAAPRARAISVGSYCASPSV